jgi:hypothetical protein
VSVLVVLVVVLVAVLFVGAAAQGRGEMPVAERIPVRQWTAADAVRNAAAGACLLADRQRRLWDRVLDELQPWRHS